MDSWPAEMSTTKDFVATAYIVSKGKVLLVHHKKLKMWLPPGGHIDEGEIPDDAAVREVKEETGLDVEIIGEKKDYSSVRILPMPRIVQLEDIEPGHQHIDLVYFAKMKDESQKTAVNLDESNDLRWFSVNELDGTVPPLVAIQAKRAIEDMK